MRNTLFISIVLLTSILSCKKVDEPIYSNRDNTKLLLGKVKGISDAHIKNKQSEGRLSDWAWHVIKEDLNGAAIGATLGAGPHVIGAAALCGGLFSYMAHMPYYGYDNCGNLVCLNCDDPGYGYSSNAVDQVGELHNNVLASALADRMQCSVIVGNGCENDVAKAIDYFTGEVASQLSISQNSLEDALSPDFLAEELEILISTMDYEDIEGYTAERLTHMYEEGYITQDVRDVLEIYYATLYELSDYEDVYDYTVNLEDEISSSSLSSADKLTLLAVFSTCRYSSGLWMNGGLL